MTAVRPTGRDRRGRRAAAAIACAGAAGAAAVLAGELRHVRGEIGAAAPRGARFRNSETSTAFEPGALWSGVREMRRVGDRRRPARAVPVIVPDFGAAAGESAATWLGHATVLLEIEGRRVLTDPVLRERCSPSRWIGPRRLHRPPVMASGLPQIDAVVISHDHYDHLERATVVRLARTQDCTFIVPMGVAAHLRKWGIDGARIVELDWGASAVVAGLSFTSCEVRHFSGRGLRRDGTQWAGWSMAGARKRVFFGGDSGGTTAFAAAGDAHGPFDLTVLPIGAYSALWPDIHMTPEEAVAACVDLNPGGRTTTLLPVHWATFDLAPHTWSEPIVRLLEAVRGRAGAPGVRIDAVVPPPGRRVDLESWAGGGEPWWSQDGIAD
ncbi:MBL fold metallo-hydrolase [Tomitella fengzijianii]|uniref:MBL fold metallo-hydrolase n=1 Tax=Tomitella fengzijianii TaxID=2597660 RepID=UPI00131E2C67|nr:MBL fold metallo-hydrolase [Tomitella fengzijianii]